MIYLDTSVALAHLLGEDRCPSDAFWREQLVSSRLLEYEMWTRVHAYGLGESHGVVLARALEPFPRPVRTLDAIHLASLVFLLGRGQQVELASYDDCLLDVAQDLGCAVFDAG